MNFASLAPIKAACNSSLVVVCCFLRSTLAFFKGKRFTSLVSDLIYVNEICDGSKSGIGSVGEDLQEKF